MEDNKEELKEEVEAKPTDAKEEKKKKKDKVEALENEIKDLKDQMLRDRAELENFKKRTNEERIKDRKYASFNLIADLINPLDNLSRVVAMETENEVLKNFLIGFKMIDNQIFEILKSDGLEEINAIGLAFDPSIHQAVATEAKEGCEAGIVLQEMQKGYKYKERVIRPSMVKVSE